MSKTPTCPECGAPTARPSGLHPYCERQRAERKAVDVDLFAGILPRSLPLPSWTDDFAELRTDAGTPVTNG